jgi:hypothetical protein
MPKSKRVETCFGKMEDLPLILITFEAQRGATTTKEPLSRSLFYVGGTQENEKK